MAMAPPLTLTLLASHCSSLPTARAWAAKASLASIRSSCSRLQPALARQRRVALTGPMPMIAGSTPALA
ncbi:hypothetical protein D3C84_862660 [compost metagenome]